MSTTDFSAPPRLAVGNHPHSKIYMCAMNVISWENGDKDITDFPDCTPKPLSRMVQMVNDTYCLHTTREVDPATDRIVNVLCASCSVKMLTLAHRTVRVPSPSYAGSWGWVADMLKAGLRTASGVAEMDFLSSALRVAEARSSGATPECPPPLPRVAISSGINEVAKSIVASERAMAHRARVAPVDAWVSAGIGEEMVTFMPKSTAWKLTTGAQVDGMWPPGLTPGANYLPELHYVRAPRDLITMAGAHFVSGHENRKTMLGRAHDAIGMWIDNAVRPLPPGVFLHPRETVAA